MHGMTQACTRLLSYKPPRLAIALFAVATALHYSIGARVPALPTSMVGATLVALSGFAVMMRAWWLFRIADTAIGPTATTTTLITNDVYGITRNPMYLGMVLILLGIAVFTGSVFHFAAAVVFFVFIDHTFCPHEERKMRGEFGSDYEDYRRRVKRWL